MCLLLLVFFSEANPNNGESLLKTKKCEKKFYKNVSRWRCSRPPHFLLRHCCVWMRKDHLRPVQHQTENKRQYSQRLKSDALVPSVFKTIWNSNNFTSLEHFIFKTRWVLNRFQDCWKDWSWNQVLVSMVVNKGCYGYNVIQSSNKKLTSSILIGQFLRPVTKIMQSFTYLFIDCLVGKNLMQLYLKL